MGDISFEWDERKSNENKSKHGVSFEEAQSVFLDERAVQFFDESHSSSEDRFLMLGMSSHFRLLVVVHAFRARDSVIRIISARRATRREGRHYAGRKP
ncbi:MAG: BrnT family toxin [Planctomycetota bacterium]